MAVGGGSCSVCKRCIALTKAGVIRLHGPVRARCSGSGLSPSRCVLPRPQTVLAGDSNQLTVPPASITIDSHSGGTQSRILDDCDDAAGVDTATNDAGVDTAANDVPEPLELVFPPDVIQSVRVLK